MTPVRPTLILKGAASFLDGLVHVVVGLFFMAGGAWLIYYGLQHPVVTVINGVTVQSLNKPVCDGGAIAAIFGALVMPTIWPLVQQIFVVVVPYIPIVGRRVSDRQPPPRAIDEPPPEGKP